MLATSEIAAKSRRISMSGLGFHRLADDDRESGDGVAHAKFCAFGNLSMERSRCRSDIMNKSEFLVMRHFPTLPKAAAVFHPIIRSPRRHDQAARSER